MRYLDAAHTVIDDGNGRMIPTDPLNSDYAALLAAGTPIAAYEPPLLTSQAYAAAIQSHIDATARAREYNDGVTCASYVASTITTWAADAGAFIAWRDAVWLSAYQTLAAVQAGQQQPPTIEALIAGLPAITWPGN